MSGWVPSTDVDLLHAVKNTFDILLGRIPNETCGDMIFSGHTRYTITSLSVISTYLSKYPLKYTLPCYLIALFLAIFAMYTFVKVDIWSYSFDCRLGCTILWMWFWLFLLLLLFIKWCVSHQLLQNPSPRLKTRHSCLGYGFRWCSGWMGRKKLQKKWKICWFSHLLLNGIVFFKQLLIMSEYRVIAIGIKFIVHSSWDRSSFCVW